MNTNFIVDMKRSTLDKIIYRFIVAFCVIYPLSEIAFMSNEKLKYTGASALSFFGFFSFLLFLIALLRKDISLKDNKIIIVALGYLLLVFISTLTAWDAKLAMNGNAGRYEGILAFVSYVGLFLAGALIINEKKIKILDIILIIGVIQCFVAIFQSFHATRDILPYYFYIAENPFNDYFIFTAGFTGSPIALATYLTLLSGISISGFCFDKSRIKSTLYGISSLIFIATTLLTNTFIGVMGLGLVSLTILFLTLTTKNTLSNKLKAISVFIALGICFFVAYLCFSWEIKDTALAFQDSFYRLTITGINKPTFTNMYPSMWEKALELISKNPLFGVGPDSFAYAGFPNNITSTPNSFDRPYNNYLYIAATQGIISALVYVGFLASAIIKGIKIIKSSKEINWINVGLLSSIIAYALLGIISCTFITVTPIFWLFIGLLISNKVYNKKA